MLKRVLEPEVMDSPDEAAAYDDMDHTEVNQRFVGDLIAFVNDGGLSTAILDVGTGTGQIPIELCRQATGCRVIGIDLSPSMIDLGRSNVREAGFASRISLELVDAKQLPFADGEFPVVISNSIVHHIPEPFGVLAESVRVTAPGGAVFFRDLLRPPDDAAVKRLVHLYAGHDDETQQRLFDDSLRASLSLAEVRDIVRQLGFDPMSVRTTSDRHWTWAARKRSAHDD
jgi:ubiquinone/menaquinone biosynthesis C-methylase UbiE